MLYELPMVFTIREHRRGPRRRLVRGDIMSPDERRGAVMASAWRNSTIIRDNVVDAVRQLKQQPSNNILVDGSSVLTQALA